jgi:hypothetical protein
MRHCVPKNAPAYHPAGDIHEAFMTLASTMLAPPPKIIPLEIQNGLARP